MSESLPPRIRVTLPETTPGQITGWQQDEDGSWWAVVTVRAPAAAVQQIPGEDYSHVPRQPAGPPTRYVLATDTRDTPPTMELHTADCWTIDQAARWWRITPVDPADARGVLGFDDTTACTACHPEP